MTERVFAVQRAEFFAGRWPAGFRDATEPEIGDLPGRFRAAGFLADRARAERNPDWKQIIPYCFLRDGAEVLCVQRLDQQSERRLHGLWSIGIGGHVEADDLGPADEPPFATALVRELREELRIPEQLAAGTRFRGLLNDDSTDVGRVHVGLVYELDLTAAPRDLRAGIAVRETAKMRGRFLPIPELGSKHPDANRVGPDDRRPPADRPEDPESAPGGTSGDLPGQVARSFGLWQDAREWESWSRILLQEGVCTASGPSFAR